MAEKQLTLFSLATSEKEDYRTLMAELSHSCHDCRLGVVLYPENRGLVWRGNLDAKIAIVAEAPGDTEMEKGLPLVGRSGRLWEKWAAFIGLDTKQDCFLSNVIQCQPPKEKATADGQAVQRAPDRDEIAACFGPRCLRILRAMPNLEVVLTLGWVAAEALLGGDPKSKTHENNWFRTSLLPGVGVFCMIHPSALLHEPSQEKTSRVQDGLKKFQREYLRLGKIKSIVERMEKEASL